MSLFSFLYSSTAESDCEIEEIFPLALTKADFVKSDIISTYLKILTDTVERTHGVPEKSQPLLWDNCVQSESPEGLISLLARAMAEKTNLFLVMKEGLGVIRRATFEEQKQIETDYAKTGSSKVGVFISFKNYRRTEMLEIYSAFEYCVLGSLNKSLNLSRAVQMKSRDLRGSVSLTDSSIAINQAKAVAVALKKGNDVLIDAGDSIETAEVDTEPAEKAMTFLDAKKAFILGLPLSYMNGEQTAGIGSTGEGDSRAVERGLKQYFVSIIQPVLKALIGAKTEFKSQDFRQIGSALDALKSLELVSEDLISIEAKRELVARMFDLDAAEEAKLLDAAEEEAQEDDSLPADENSREAKAKEEG